jgi:hypothetical protein
MSMKLEGMYGPSDVIPPRPATPQPPGIDALATQVADIEATLQDATALERHLEGSA